MIGAGERLARHCADRVQHGNGVLMAGTVRLALEYFHEVGDEEVVLEGGHTLFREDGSLAAHGAGEGQALGRDVVLKTPGQGGRGESSGAAQSPWQRAGSQAGRGRASLQKGSRAGQALSVPRSVRRGFQAPGPLCHALTWGFCSFSWPPAPTNCGSQRFQMNLPDCLGPAHPLQSRPPIQLPPPCPSTGFSFLLMQPPPTRYHFGGREGACPQGHSAPGRGSEQ